MMNERRCPMYRDKYPTYGDWVMVALCVVLVGAMVASCVVIPAGPVYIGGHGHAQSNTGPGARQDAPGVPAGEVKINLGGVELAVPTSQPTR